MSEIRPDIDQALQWMNALQRASARREIRSLEGKLNEGETVERIAQGRYEGKEGLVVLTNQRVLFSEEGLTRSRIEDFQLKSISTVQHQTALIAGTITIFASGNKAVIDNIVPKQNAVSFADALRQRLSAASSPATAASPTASADSLDPFDRLKRLAELRDAGAISDEDYEAKKRELLSQI